MKSDAESGRAETGVKRPTSPSTIAAPKHEAPVASMPGRVPDESDEEPALEAVQDQGDVDTPTSPESQPNATEATNSSMFQSIRSSIKLQGNKGNGDIPFAGDKEDGNWNGSHRERLEAFVLSPKFEVCFAALIMANTVVMAAQVQYRGLDTGYLISYYGMTSPADLVWPGAEVAFNVLEWCFGVVFAIEIILKMVAIDYRFFCDAWNILDLAVVVCWFIDTLANGVLPVDPMLLRLARLMKLLRMIRLIRTIQGFDSLYVMVTAIKGSVSALLWSVTLLFAVLWILALFLTTMVEPYINDKSNPLERRMAVYTYYGTFTRACLTLFELTLANWPTASRVLTENVDEMYFFFVMGFQFIIGFSVMKVIMGVFLQVTFYVASNDDMIMMNQRDRAIKTHTAKMSLLFTAADEDGNGRLDEDEFQNIIDDPTVVSWLSAMGFEAAYFDGREVYKLLCADDRSDLSAADLVRGVSKLKGPATSLNMAMMQRDMKESHSIVKKVQKRLDRLQARLGLTPLERETSVDSAGGSDKRVSEASVDTADKGEQSKGVAPGRSRVSEVMFDSDKMASVVDLPEATGTMGRLRKKLLEVVLSFPFETTFAVLIGANTIVMAAQVQYRGFDSGFDLGFAGATQPAHEVWPGALEAFQVIELCFGILFTVEIALKLLALLNRFFKDAWNLLDIVVVGVWYVEAFTTASLPLDPMLLRLFRLVKLARMVRLVKIFEKHEKLYLMVTSIKGSIAALAWSSSFLLIVEVMLSLTMATLIESYLTDEDTDGDKHKVYEYYGTFSRAMLTMFEITLANWVPVTRIMMKNVTQGYVVFALLHKFIFGFAVVMVITGVFIQETMKVAQTDNTIMLNQRERASRLHVKKMTALFKVADADGSGRLDIDEFMEVCADESVKVWLSAMGLDVSDGRSVHESICEQVGSDALTAQELVIGVSKLKGAARNIDMAILRNENQHLRDTIKEIQAKIVRVGSHCCGDKSATEKLE